MTQEGWERPRSFDPIGRQVGVTARAMRVLLDGALATAGSTFADWTVLATLNARGPLVQKDLAKSLGMIGPSVVERIDRLEKAGLVARSAVPGDRRASLVSMTDAGLERFGILHDVLRSTETALTNGIDPRDLETTLRVLAQIAERARTLRTSGQAIHAETGGHHHRAGTAGPGRHAVLRALGKDRQPGLTAVLPGDAG